MTGETILVIDTDNETTQKIVSVLESEEFLVFTASSGDVGITMAKKVNPALIFINPAMSGASGLDICKTIHNTESLRNVPIVVLSAFEAATDPRYASVYGIVDSLKKPFLPEELIVKTKNVLSGKPVEAQPEAVPEIEEEYGDRTQIINTRTQRTQPVPDIHEEASEDTVLPGKTMVKMKTEPELSDTTIVKIKTEPEPSDKTIVKTRDEPEHSDRTIVKPVKREIREEKPQRINIRTEEPEKPIADRTYVLKKNIRRRDMNNRFLGLIITVVIVAILGGAGFFLYQKGLLPFIGKKAQKPVAVKPAQPAEQQSAQAPLQQEQQKPQQSAEGKKPTPSQKPAPAPSQPQAKPAGKGVYSVQIGSFKSETNASALAKQFKDKGYDAFTYKAQKGKETIYRVLIGKYDNRKEALKLASEVRAKEKAKAIVVKE